jgi:hypothetical protein
MQFDFRRIEADSWPVEHTPGAEVRPKPSKASPEAPFPGSLAWEPTATCA